MGLLAAGVLGLLLPSITAAQAPGAAGGIELQWALRGIVTGDAGPAAILEYRPTGGQRLVHPGDALSDAVTVGEIAPGHLTLNADGGPMMLRLGHVETVQRTVRPRFPIQRQPLLPTRVPTFRR